MWAGLPTILVVDDDPLIGDLLQGLLELEGYHVETAVTAFDGLNRLVANSVDLALVHLSLPDFGAIAFCRQVRRREQEQWLQSREHHLPIIVTSAWSDAERFDAVLAAGADEYLFKPFEIDQLVGTIQRLLTEKDRSDLASSADPSRSETSMR